MKLAVILIGSGGELAREVVEIPNTDDNSEAISIAAQSVIENWTLSPGDTIELRDAEA